MEKFTKGPWSPQGNLVYAPSKGDDVVVAATGCVNQVSEFNCHLIAAAPEMYVMLDTIETVLSGRSEYHPAEISVDYIRKLLAKARGE